VGSQKPELMNKDEVIKVNFMIIKRMIMSKKGRDIIANYIGREKYKRYINYLISENILKGDDLLKVNTSIKEETAYRKGKADEFKISIQHGFHVLCDGGTTSNNPQRYGETYGSFMYFNNGCSSGLERESFGRGSVNYAEISTVTQALKFIRNERNCNRVSLAEDEHLHIHCDSQIAVKWVNMFAKDPRCPINASKGSSQLFLDALDQLQSVIRDYPVKLSASWVPREVCVEYLGH